MQRVIRILAGVTLMIIGIASLWFLGWVGLSESCQRYSSCQQMDQTMREQPMTTWAAITLLFLLIFAGLKLICPQCLRRKDD